MTSSKNARRLIVLAVLVLLHIPTGTLHNATGLRLPLVMSDHDWPPLRKAENADFESKLAKRLEAHPLWSSLIHKKRMAVGLVDLRNPDGLRFACVNGDVMMYAASLPKIAVLFAACQSFEDGSLKETPQVLEDMTEMIRYSNNQAATRMIDRLGFKKIAATLMNPKYKLFDPQHGGGLWVGKRYAKLGQRYPDPLQGLSHAATVTQVCRFYYLLATGKLINPYRCQQMLQALSDPGLHHKFVHALDKLAPDARLFRKSGSWRNWHADSVLVWEEDGRKYVLVGLVEDAKGEQILRDLVPVVEDVLYN